MTEAESDRFPFLVAVTPDLSWAADAVCRVTGCKCLKNLYRKTLHFFYKTPDVGVWEEKYEGRRFTQSDVDVAVRMILSARMPKSEKDLRQRRQRESWAKDRDRMIENFVEDNIREVEKKTKYDLDRIGQHGSRSVIVDGLKGASA